MATLSMFIGFSRRISLDAISLAGVTVNGLAMALTKKYQKKLSKITELADLVTSALAVFQTSVSKLLNNHKIDQLEFAALQTLHLGALNELAIIDCKMEAETRAQLQKVYWKKSTTSRIPSELLRNVCTLPCVLFHLLPQCQKWISW